MAESENNQPAADAAGKTKAAVQIKGDDLDEGLDLNNLPGPPWTLDALGDELYGKLARVSGTFDPRLEKGFTPALDPRNFAAARFARRAREYGIALPPTTVTTQEAAEKWFAAQHRDDPDRLQRHIAQYNELMSEAETLAELINAKLPGPQGTQRAAGAKPLMPAKLQFRKRQF